ncbi:class I SAM-dependent methyltransferase [Nitrosomonas sp. Is37]|uniref:class I SAM-dependent methyltransferase n=1 Tax=Nitrosomonas sp. Is37 TaxID=3080535 RepID=UPI00294B5AF0|nr:class I SAM-dependent methyltransferase [Nitrosomonas sp. Is37]MDV6344258.1 class I SAM-dependent methyltransferase [Nitrosomonas sp. Is37]
MSKIIISPNTIPAEWDEAAYLSINPDVAKAVQQGVFSSGYDHFKQYGNYEKRNNAFRKQNGSQKFHFVEDYRNLVRNLMEQYPLDEAMSRAIGGNFVAWGQIEKQLLIHYGLLPDHTLIDVGCGSGRLAKAMIPYLVNGKYLGTDVVDELLDYAKKDSPSNWQFKKVENISIPYPNSCADFCVFFSVFTHLLYEEIYCYLLEARRVIKKDGMIIFSFLEFPQNWDIFEATYANILLGKPNVHLNTFIGRDAIKCWASRLDLSIVSITAGNEPFILLPQPITLEDGRVIEGLQAFGQSVCALKA